ncbi:MAG: hypothetical protein U0271_44745 [Polyangiaceae bacterium]
MNQTSKMVVRSALVSTWLVVGAVACGSSEKGSSEPTASAEASSSSSSSASTSSSAAKEPAAPKPAVEWTGFSTPESVLIDDDRYCVSNVNGKALEADNNGFISELSPDGQVKNLKWIEGGKNKVTLNAPKGMALAGGVLYVADLDTVRMFDAKSGAPKGEVKIPKATFLNDVAAGPDGKIYVTDSGLKQGASDFEPSGTDAVWVIEKGKAKALAQSADLNKPNGVTVDARGVWVSTFGAAEVFLLGADGKKGEVLKTPAPSLDGLAWVGDKVLVSSWQSKTIYVGSAGKFEAVLTNLAAPADFGVDVKRGRVVVPRFMDNVVQAYELAL